jgi:serine/threonine protein kinase
MDAKSRHIGLRTANVLALADIPGMLSGNVLRLLQDLPLIDCPFEIWGNEVRKLEVVSKPPIYADDTEDISIELSDLPLIQVDMSKHHVKRGKYRSEIQNLLKCQGGSCPGTRLSPHIVQLLGKSVNNDLVFEKLTPRYLILPRFCAIDVYQRWILHIIAAFKCLHGLSIVYRDLHIENLLFSPQGDRLVLGDIEGRWGQRGAPEIAREDRLDSGWTEKSDILDIGTCIKCIIYANIPVTSLVEWPVPEPFEAIDKACMRSSPGSRPTLDDLQAMVETIKI